MAPENRALPTGSTSRTAATTGLVRLPVWLCALQLILAYEWLLSGYDKLLNPGFDADLPGELRKGLKDNPYQWYTAFIQQVVLPNHTLFAVAVKWAETAIGATLLLSAVLWLIQPKTRITALVAWGACLALVGAAVLALNYFFQGATALPWIDPAQAYHPAVDIGILVPLVSMALLSATVQVLRRHERYWLVDPDTGAVERGGQARAS